MEPHIRAIAEAVGVIRTAADALGGLLASYDEKAAEVTAVKAELFKLNNEFLERARALGVLKEQETAVRDRLAALRARYVAAR